MDFRNIYCWGCKGCLTSMQRSWVRGIAEYGLVCHVLVMAGRKGGPMLHPGHTLGTTSLSLLKAAGLQGHLLCCWGSDSVFMRVYLYLRMSCFPPMTTPGHIYIFFFLYLALLTSATDHLNRLPGFQSPGFCVWNSFTFFFTQSSWSLTVPLADTIFFFFSSVFP